MSDLVRHAGITHLIGKYSVLVLGYGSNFIQSIPGADPLFRVLIEKLIEIMYSSTISIHLI